MATSKGTDARRDPRRRQSTRRRPNSEAPPPDSAAESPPAGSQTTDDYDDEPLSLAEEIADEVSRGVTDDTNRESSTPFRYHVTTPNDVSRVTTTWFHSPNTNDPDVKNA